MDFKQITKTILQRKDLAEDELAYQVGCDQTTINRIKRGVIKCPNWELGQRLIDIYNEIESSNSSAA